MNKVIAIQRGYFGNVLREVGDKFVIPNEVWNDERRRPSWVKLDPASMFGGKGDHDGNGEVGGSKPRKTVEGENVKAVLVVPADWRSHSAADRKALAAQIAGKEVKKASDADAIIEAHVEATKPEPFGDAPQPQTVAEATRAIGGVQPDWVAPGAPEPVAD